MFWHLRMILAYKKTLGKFTKVLGFEKTPPPFGKNSQKIPFFFVGSVPNIPGFRTYIGCFRKRDTGYKIWLLTFWQIQRQQLLRLLNFNLKFFSYGPEKMTTWDLNHDFLTNAINTTTPPLQTKRWNGFSPNKVKDYWIGDKLIQKTDFLSFVLLTNSSWLWDNFHWGF